MLTDQRPTQRNELLFSVLIQPSKKYKHFFTCHSQSRRRAQVCFRRLMCFHFSGLSLQFLFFYHHPRHEFAPRRRVFTVTLLASRMIARAMSPYPSVTILHCSLQKSMIIFFFILFFRYNVDWVFNFFFLYFLSSATFDFTDMTPGHLICKDGCLTKGGNFF